MAHRCNLILSDPAYNELKQLSREDNRTMTEIIRLGVGLYKVARRTEANGNMLLVAKPDGTAVHEVVIPK